MKPQPSTGSKQPEDPTNSDDPQDQPDFGISDIQRRSIELAILGHSDISIANQLSISRKTIWRWKNLDESYRFALAYARAQTRDTTIDRYQQTVLAAVGILAKSLAHDDDKIRLRAAQILLSKAGPLSPQNITQFQELPKSAPQEWDILGHTATPQREKPKK